MTDDSSAVVDNLVTQFSSPLHCFRELVQNSIDAGSPTVDVWTEYVEGDGHEGTIALHVDDYGEGMDEHIIDQELTRLFASSKEKDLTKIGQFGIGFVSTFALDPEAIQVETGRSGEYWEVLFHEDRSFTKRKLDVPVEGTQVTIYLTGDIHRYNQLVEDIEKTLKHWCSHSDTEVTFEDRTPVDGASPELVRINDPFEVEGDCNVRVEHEGTEIVAAYSDDPAYGFYNSGLTLALTRSGDDILGDQRAARFRYITFKIKSRYLEHTLSRETVMKDANYEKAMTLLEEAAADQLFDNLTGALEQLVADDDWGLSDVDRYGRFCRYLDAEPRDQLSDIDDRPLLRLVDGTAATLADAYDAWNRDGRVLVTDEHTDLSEQLLAEGIPVFLGTSSAEAEFQEATDPVPALIIDYIEACEEATLMNRMRSGVSSLFGVDWSSEVDPVVTDPDSVYLPVVVDDELPDAVAQLVERAGELLEGVDAGYGRLATCTMGVPQDDPPLFVFARELSSVMARPPTRRRPTEDQFEDRPDGAINRDHPHFRRIAEMWNDEPDIAAYCLAKSLLLTHDRLLTLDRGLMEGARAG
ncbi:MAG: ATP-binding protein [Bradymonadaceae bacterium]